MTRAAVPHQSGALEFTRFAYPPNALGLCGPGDACELLELAASLQAGARSGDDQARLRMLAGGFDGAWPYLQLIAAANRRRDPLDSGVVQAYWLGNDLLDAVPAAMLGDDLDERFRRRAARHWDALTGGLDRGARPHHNFHVFCVYPWVGLLRHSAREQALRVLDRCRIRWGRVNAVLNDEAVISYQPLLWDGTALNLGAPATEQVPWQRRGYALTPTPERGDVVALHWDWLVRPITAAELTALRHQTARNLVIANATLRAAPLAQ